MPLKTLSVTGPRIESDVLKFVVDDDYCKEQEVLAANPDSDAADNAVDIGTVLGLDVHGNYWPLDLSVTDIQDAEAVSLSKRTALAGGANENIVILKRGPAIIDDRNLIWPAGITDNQKAAALVQLEAKGIVAHSS